MFWDVDGTDWYSTLQCSGERSHRLSGPTILLKSTDSGASWSLGSLIGYTTDNRVQLIEPDVAFRGTDLHIIARSVTVAIIHFKSVDSGITWTAEANIPLLTLSSKPSMINYTNSVPEQMRAMALTLVNEIPGKSGRTTLGIYTTDDFVTFNEVEKIITETYCHYPTLRYFDDKLYISYTKGIGAVSSPLDRNTIVVTRIY